uniref:AsnC/Lrp family regulatory protein n=1 Tax=uncultured marine thaumarchaeote AD1000_18_B11 TaxID=1455896 RepID=A0A075FKD3_9ARCH|nr:AsnC/Lrp family regulatory protein [uncultured marine thaumarchaeote AD1000_18_B11]
MHKGFVLLNCDLGAEEFIVDELRKISQVSQAYVTFGAYDVIAEINTDSQEDFDETVSFKIRRLTRIVSTMTLNVIGS